MRKPIHTAVLVSLLATVSGVMWLLLHSLTAEPVYGGRPLTAWMDQYQEHLMAQQSSAVGAKRDAARNAIRHIGTNALPTLLRMTATKDSALKTRVIGLLSKQRLIDLTFHSPDYYHAKATYGFGALGPLAKPAVPALMGLLSDSDKEVRASAAQCLSLIGPEAKEAVPALVRLLNDAGNGYGPIILNSMQALGCINAEPETVVPLLLECISGSRKAWNYGVPALDALARYREKARSAVPAILPLLNDPDESHRNSALNALWRIDAEAAARARTK